MGAAQPAHRIVAEELLPWLSDQHREMLDSLPAFADRTYADALSLRSSSGFDAALELARSELSQNRNNGRAWAVAVKCSCASKSTGSSRGLISTCLYRAIQISLPHAGHSSKIGTVFPTASLGAVGNDHFVDTAVRTKRFGRDMNEVTARLKSVHLKNERLIWVRPPRDPVAAAHVSVFLDGELYRDRVGANSVIDDLQGDIADSWFVYVSMESVEARWLECACYQPFARFVAEELLPWLSEQHREMLIAKSKTLIGLSYSGLAAAFVAKEFPGAFQRVITQSGSFWWNDCWLPEQYRLSAPVPTDFYLDVGTKELAENVLHREDVMQVVSQREGVHTFRDVLRSKGYVVQYVEFEGAHDFTAWRQTLPGALRWALPI